MNFPRFIIFSILGGLLGLGGAVFIASVLPPVYEASLTISPSSYGPRSTGISLDLSVSAESLLSGSDPISGGQPGRANYERFLAVLSGRGLAQEIAVSPVLMHRMFASQWDPVKRRWHPPTGLAAAASRSLRSTYGLPDWSPPDTDAVLRFLDAHLLITPLRKGTLHELSVVSDDKGLALDLLRFVLTHADSTLRDHDLENTSFNVEYLYQQLRTVPVAELQSAISKSLSGELLRQMNTRNPRPYAIEVFSTPALHSRPVFPNPVMMTLFGLLGGMVVGALTAFLTTRRGWS